MKHFIMVGADLHDKTIRYRVAVDKERSKGRTVLHTPEGRREMVKALKALSERYQGAAIYLGFEAGPHGFGLYDELEAAGVRCAPLAPTEMEKSSDARVQKTDDKDAERILEVVRSWVLAGKDPPLVAVPDPQTRLDREPVRLRVRVGCRTGKIKTQVRSLLTRHSLRCDGSFDGEHLQALKRLSETMARSLGATLRSLLQELEWAEEQKHDLDEIIGELAETPRYRPAVAALRTLKGVGVLTAMSVILEFGDPGRFENRRQVGSFLGLVPTQADSGARVDRLGHITKKGPGLVRRLLCQAAWAVIREDKAVGVKYQKWCRKHPQEKMVFVVAQMRRLGIRAWHKLQDAYREKPMSVLPNTPPYWCMRFSVNNRNVRRRA